jgi:hypothetical protein
VATPQFDDSEFLLGYCVGCSKEVLTHVDFGPDDLPIRLCLHCDLEIDGGLHAVTGQQLSTSGYAVLEARSCGNGGGCSAGGCGARQRPESGDE